MFQLLNRITWVLCICLGVIIASIDVDFILPWIIIAVAIKYIVFSPDYIKSRLQFFKTGLLKTDSPLSQLLPLQEKGADEEKNTVKNADMHSEEDTSYIASQVQEDEDEDVIQKPTLPQEPNIIQKFFSENLLAKIGWIIVFLWVLFLLTAIYAAFWPVGKIIIWFMIGFSCYGAGVWLGSKWFTNESRIVMGVAILINYLVILSGRYLLWDTSSTDATLLSVSMTFIFLILNTVFAVITALLYKSRALLIFSFAFAYINPLLLWESSSEPYTLLGYTMIVTLWALYMSYSRKDSILFPLTFILASIMFLIAPWSDGAGWITKLLCINTLWALSLYVSTTFQKSFQNISEILIAGMFFLIGIMWFLWIESLSSLQMIIMWASSLSLMAFCYASGNRWAYMYSIGTLGTILTLSPAIYTNGLQENILWISIGIIAVFGIMNIWLVLAKPKEFLAHNLSNIISGLLSGAVFLTYMIYFFGNEFFSGMVQWFAFFGLAIIYCSLAFLIVSKIGIETMKTDEKYENTFYTISAIWISLFSLAVAFVFSESKEIVSIIWLLEANVLFFLSSKTKSIKITIAWLVLFVIWVVKFADFIDFGIFWWTSFSWDYGMLVALCIVLASLMYNLIVLFNQKTKSLDITFYGIHNFFHLIAISLIIFTGHEILDISWNWNSLLYFSIAIAALWALYDRIASASLRNIHLIAYLILMCIHIIWFADDMGSEQLKIGISTLIAVIYALPFIYDKVMGQTIRNKKLFTVFGFYLFILSTLYILHLFTVDLWVTLYWGVLAFIFLSYGINKDITYLRTIGLYCITLTVIKIFFHDVWQNGVNGIIPFIAFMIVWILMIVLSTMYTKKLGNTLGKDFSLSNLFPKKASSSEKISPVENAGMHSENTTEKSKIQSDIESIDITNISSVKLHFTWSEKPVVIRAENLIKISKLIANTYKKTEFKPGELKSAYSMIEKDYKSSLSPVQYKKMKDLVAQFVEKWGSIEFVK